MNATVDKIWNNLTDALFGDIPNFFNEYTIRKPLLAHYTSMAVIESILINDEIWFSNPLFMNDLEEVRFGIANGLQYIKENEAIKQALGNRVRHEIFLETLDAAFNHYDENYLFDTYVFCLTEHDPGDTDGLLSMWRGYGGAGKGAALIIDTAKIDQIEDSPLIFAPVDYATNEERFRWFNQLCVTLAGAIPNNNIPDEYIYLASNAALERLKLTALFSKHIGFSEEREWRVVYMRDRDPEEKLLGMLNYFSGIRGVEPKLRFKLGHIDGVTSENMSLENILHSIILGPTASSPLALKSVQRMLQVIGKPNLQERVVASTIPLRGS